MRSDITTLKRYLISTGLTFLSVFVPMFLLSIQDALTNGDVTGRLVLALLCGTAATASRTVLKAGLERYQGIV